MREMIIGVDGGGTKTNVVALDAANGKEVARATAGSINVNFGGMENAVANIKAALDGLMLDPADKILALAIGDPALDDSEAEDGAKFRSRVNDLVGKDVQCFSKSDVFMALYGFTGGEPGALLVAGTGSMGVGLKESYRHGIFNPVLTVGGWGNPTTDPGSGNDIAIRGLCAAMDAFDGIGLKTLLCEKALDFYGVKEPRALAFVMNDETMTRSRIAAFAKCVAECAEEGDDISNGILNSAGTVLGKYACSLLEKIGGKNQRIGVYGSVLINNKQVYRIFAETIKNQFPNAQIGIPTQPPEYGAARFAADALGIHWEESL